EIRQKAVYLYLIADLYRKIFSDLRNASAKDYDKQRIVEFMEGWLQRNSPGYIKEHLQPILDNNKVSSFAKKNTNQLETLYKYTVLNYWQSLFEAHKNRGTKQLFEAMQTIFFDMISGRYGAYLYNLLMPQLLNVYYEYHDEATILSPLVAEKVYEIN